MLVYYFLNDHRNFKNCDLNFSNNLNFNYDKENKKFIIKKNENFLKNYWGVNLESVTTIAGNNGVGKTSILESIKNRFLSGFATLPLDTILVVKKDEFYFIYYSEKFLDEKSFIVINDNQYCFSKLQLSKEENIKILNISMGNEDLKLQFHKVTNKSLEEDSNEIRRKTRLGNKRSLIFYTSHWNYSIYNRNYEKFTKTNNLDYIDLSVSHKVDSSVNSFVFDEDEAIFSDDMRIVNGVSNNSRIDLDYLYELKVGEIRTTLRYLNESANDKSINENLIIPEEIKIYYDFITSEKRKESIFFNIDSDMYLRFEKKDENFFFEQIFYRYILDSKSKIELTETMILILVENLFSNLSHILPKGITEKIKESEKSVIYNLIRNEDIIPLLRKFSEISLNELENLTFKKKIEKERKRVIKTRVERLLDDYLNFIQYVLEDFLKNAEYITAEPHIVHFAQVDKNKVSINEKIEINIPAIKLNNVSTKYMYSFVERYNRLTGKEKSLHFVWRNLSSGEIHLLNLCTSLYVSIKDSVYKDVLILLDEAEISLHPMLQKKIMSILLNILNSSELQEKKIQIILSTHSPFVLSELPFNSLILLKKEDAGNVIVQNELENTPSTLGANIHDLFSHSFFLSDGLIGEYAKGKINEVANNLLNNNLNEVLDQDYIEKFINQIGEPIIKARLIELYDQRRILNKPKEMDSIIQDIERLKIQLKNLEEKRD
ncbi:AAA family ATPase [Exiguobacterium artemiae]|uniref:AAA family ATPase n=1 Tax=Exiguobacterium artemiae TaxID=340145 RepID=UPI003CFBF4A7